MPIEIVTYKEIMEKYPEARADIQKLQESKNAALTGNRVVCFILGALTSWFVYVFIPSIL